MGKAAVLHAAAVEIFLRAAFQVLDGLFSISHPLGFLPYQG